MGLSWIRENPATWDADKLRVIMGGPKGIFDERYGHLREGSLVPGEWWRVERDGEVVGYGCLDAVWGNAEVLLAIAGGAQRQGIGGFIVEQLDEEARARGLNYLYNVISPKHPDEPGLRGFLEAAGFVGFPSGRLFKRSTRRQEGAAAPEAT